MNSINCVVKLFIIAEFQLLHDSTVNMFRPHTVAVDNEINFKLLNLNDESTKKLVNIEDYELMDKSANSGMVRRLFS